MGGGEKYVKKLKSVSYFERWQTSKRQLGLCSVEIHRVFCLRLRLMFQTKDNGRYRYQERIILKPKTAIGDFYTTWGGRWQQQRSFVKIKRGRNWKERKRKKNIFDSDPVQHQWFEQFFGWLSLWLYIRFFPSCVIFV